MGAFNGRASSERGGGAKRRRGFLPSPVTNARAGGSAERTTVTFLQFASQETGREMNHCRGRRNVNVLFWLSSEIENNQISSIDIRIHPKLKASLDLYCEAHLEKMAEAVSNAIKNYIGFGHKTSIRKNARDFEKDAGKTLRLDIRVHSRLKEALQEYCKKNDEKVTDAVTNAVKRYINFKKE
jgi:hypothetical protein